MFRYSERTHETLRSEGLVSQVSNQSCCQGFSFFLGGALRIVFQYFFCCCPLQRIHRQRFWKMSPQALFAHKRARNCAPNWIHKYLSTKAFHCGMHHAGAMQSKCVSCWQFSKISSAKNERQPCRQAVNSEPETTNISLQRSRFYSLQIVPIATQNWISDLENLNLILVIMSTRSNYKSAGH